MARKGLKVATATINGKREYFYAKTKREAILRAEAAKIKKAGRRPSNKMLYAEWLKTYLAITRDRVTAATLESYRTLINKHIVPRFGHLPLMDLDHIEIREYLSQMLAQGLSPRTVNYVHTLFKTTLKQAVEDGLLAQNPMDKVHKVKQPRSTARAILTVDDFDKLLRAATNDEIRRLMSVALSTGLRREEILGLRWMDVDLSARRISVNQTIIKVGSQIIATPLTKTAASRRTIKIDARTADILRTQKAYDDEKAACAIGFYIDRGLVFSNKVGDAISPMGLTRRIETIVKRAGLPRGVTYYSFRHTHATLLLSRGVNIKVIQSRLGHASITTTLNTYAHLTTDDEEQAAGAMETVFSLLPSQQ